MNKKLLIIADPAHGADVAGKRSPDGKHREYKWSRERWANIYTKLIDLGYTVVYTNELDDEIGLTKRQNVGNAYAKRYSGLIPLLISLHNDAKGNGTTWETATGISVWTSKGQTTSDIFANIFIENVKPLVPNVRQRIYNNKYLERDFENDFTVLLSKHYFALLIECMFQDNKEDVAKLQDPAFNAQIEDWIIQSIEDCNKYVTEKMKK